MKRRFQDMVSICWLIAIIVLIIIEFFTMGLTTIWFAGGALIALIAALAGAGLAVQIILFAVISVVLLIFTRPFARKYINKNTVKTNVDSLIGQKARVTVRIDNKAGTGEAVLSGQSWTARASSDEATYEPDAMVVVEAVKGVKLIVRSEETEG